MDVPCAVSTREIGGFVGGRNADVANLAVGPLHDPAAFVEGELAIHFVPMRLREPGGIVGPPSSSASIMKITSRLSGTLFARQAHDGFGEDGDAALEIDGAASPHVAVFDQPAKGRRSIVALDADHVGMGGDQDGLRAAVAFESARSGGICRLAESEKSRS